MAIVQRRCVILCPSCGVAIPLPFQGPKGKVQHPHYWPKDFWPLTFVCHDCAVPSVHTESDVRRRTIQVPAPGQPRDILWLVVFRCGHENCEELVAIHSNAPSSFSKDEVIKRILIVVSNHVPCGKRHMLTIPPAAVHSAQIVCRL